ncbi:MAG: heparinase II/III-family protein [Planctomycetes bacterium]|nr:heparinase II/III-family protein [Planctomycetota bacterium]
MSLNRSGSDATPGATFFAFLTLASLATADAPPQVRIDEIAAMLDKPPASLAPLCAERRVWDELARRKDYQDVLAAAEKLLAEPLPEQPDELFLDYSRTGNRRRWERVASSRRARVKTLVIAECVENKGRFLPAFATLVHALCDEPTWVYPAHDRALRNFRSAQVDIDLGSSYVAAELALARHLLGDKLEQETRALIETNVQARVLVPFREMVLGQREPNWWLTGTNNWNSVCLAGVTHTALALLEDRAQRAFYIAAAEQYSKNFLRGFTADGYCSEGLGYWNYGFGRYAMLGELVNRATHGRLDLMALDAARQPAQFGRRVEIIGGVYPAFADCPLNTRPDPVLTSYIDRHLRLGLPASAHGEPDARRGSLAQVVAFALADRAAPSAEKRGAAAIPPLRTWFEDAGVLICRPAPSSAGRLGVALKGGHNAEHHNHNDIGSFIVVTGNQPVLVDPGTEVYTARTFSSRRYDSNVLNSFGHPVPVVAGTLQHPGAKARGRVLRTGFTDGQDTLVLDLRSAYAVPALQRLEREFRYERGGTARLVLTDIVEFAEPERFEVALVTFGSWCQVKPGLLRVEDEGQAVDVELETDGAEFVVRSKQIDEDVRMPRKPTRIAIKLAQPVRAARLTMRITPAVTAAKP